jgi:hypothetical protein
VRVLPATGRSIFLHDYTPPSRLQDVLLRRVARVAGRACLGTFWQIAPDGLAGSSRANDTPVVLRYSAVHPGDDEVTETAVVLYSGLEGEPITLGTWDISNAFGGPCPLEGCFAGDYRYGAFWQKVGDSLRYFTPWTGEASSGTGIRAHGGFVHVTP